MWAVSSGPRPARPAGASGPPGRSKVAAGSAWAGVRRIPTDGSPGEPGIAKNRPAGDACRAVWYMQWLVTGDRSLDFCGNRLLVVAECQQLSFDPAVTG